ncbi:MAG TPA: glycosyl hydrolase family 18 protein [Bryobacteraceae bacterium]|nr:glycosyl hydrolase family 18 protein [Bryobacteraceae bacterium]
MKVCILAWANNRSDSDGYLANHPDEAVENLLAYVRDNGLDGISYDDEMIGRTNSRTGGPSQPLVSAFFQKLYQAFKSANSSYQISYAAPPVISSKDRFGSDWFDWSAIAPCVDAIVPMLYTANPPSIGWTTVAEPLAGSKQTGSTVPRDVVTLMGDYYEALGDQKSKLLLGVNSFPWSGYEFRARSAARLAAILERGKTQPYEYMQAQAALYGKRWDSKQQSTWYASQDGEEFIQGWFDDEHSWAAKLDYVNQEELGGVGIWVVDGQNDSPAMWDMLRTAFSAPKSRIANP